MKECGDVGEIIHDIRRHYQDVIETSSWSSTPIERDFFNHDRVGSYHTVMYVPQEDNYDDAMRLLRRDDIVCDMGAGDLRFALLASGKCKKVYAVEMNPVTMSDALNIIGYRLPRNLLAVCSDWRYFPLPRDATVVMCIVNIDPRCLPRHWWRDGVRVYHGTTWTGRVEELQEKQRRTEK